MEEREREREKERERLSSFQKCSERQKWDPSAIGEKEKCGGASQ